MTFIDFEEESIQDEIKHIHDSKTEFDYMSDEGKRKNTRSVEDLLKELGDDPDN